MGLLPIGLPRVYCYTPTTGSCSDLKRLSNSITLTKAVTTGYAGRRPTGGLAEDFDCGAGWSTEHLSAVM